MLTCRFITTLQDLGTVSQSWDALVERSEFPDIYATAGFVRAWWEAYGTSRTLQIAIVEDGPTLRLVAPFYFEDASPDTWKLIGNVRADYNSIVCSPGDHEALARLFSWLETQSRWQVMHLTHVPGATLLQHFRRAYEGDSSVVRKVAAWLALSSPIVYRTWQEIHPRIRGHKLDELSDLLDRPSHRKHLNWFRRQGQLDYECVTDPVEIRAWLPHFHELHVREWRGKGQRSLFLESSNVAFYERLTHELADYNALRLDLLKLDGRLVAAHFGFTWAGRVYWYKPCYDPTVGSHSPGKLLLAYVICGAVRERQEEVDLLYGVEAYKTQYASDLRKTGSLIIQRSRVRAFRRRLAETRPVRRRERQKTAAVCSVSSS